MTSYKYRPFKFYAIVFAFTWAFWVTGIFVPESLALSLMFFGLCVPAVAAIVTVMFSKSSELKADFKRKIFRFYQISPINIIQAVVLYGVIVCLSIVLSVLFFGQSFNQFSFVDFSFSIKGSSALLTILLASIIEEIGWRGYGEDSIAQYHTWFKESVLFGAIWSFWHIPLFFIEGTYHHGLIQYGSATGFTYIFALNFLVSVIPLGFITTWVYVKNNRSMLACIIFHVFVNFFQEKIAMTPETKCVQTLIVFMSAALIVFTNKEMFFGKKHIGRLLEESNAIK